MADDFPGLARHRAVSLVVSFPDLLQAFDHDWSSGCKPLFNDPLIADLVATVTVFNMRFLVAPPPPSDNTLQFGHGALGNNRNIARPFPS